MVSYKWWTAKAPSELWKNAWRKNGKSMVSQMSKLNAQKLRWTAIAIWGLRRAEELVKQHPAASSKRVEVERGSSTRERGIYVDGVRVFEQIWRFSKDGVCLQAFTSLSLR